MALVEMLVASALVVSTILLVFEVFGTAYRSLGQARSITQAAALAQQVLGTQSAIPYASLATGAQPPVSVDVSMIVNNVTVLQKMTYAVSVNEKVTGKIKDVLVVVNWVEKDEARSVQMETYVSQP
jgi:hypothetical protein